MAILIFSIEMVCFVSSLVTTFVLLYLSAPLVLCRLYYTTYIVARWVDIWDARSCCVQLSVASSGRACTSPLFSFVESVFSVSKTRGQLKRLLVCCSLLRIRLLVLNTSLWTLSCSCRSQSVVTTLYLLLLIAFRVLFVLFRLVQI